MNDTELEKPPLGVMPRKLHEEKRYKELKRAITEYVEADYAVPLEWVSEYNEILEKNWKNEKGSANFSFVLRDKV